VAAKKRPSRRSDLSFPMRACQRSAVVLASCQLPEVDREPGTIVSAASAPGRGVAARGIGRIRRIGPIGRGDVSDNAGDRPWLTAMIDPDRERSATRRHAPRVSRLTLASQAHHAFSPKAPQWYQRVKATFTR
jgi:hypothetical protein